MRIAFVEFSPSGGLFQFAYQLGDGLAAQGNEVELLTGPKPELDASASGLVVRSVLPTWHAGSAGVDSVLLRRLRRGVRALRHLAALMFVLAHVARRRPDVVVWHELRFPIDCWAVTFAARFLRSANTIVLHEPRPLTEQPGTTDLYKTSRVLESTLASAIRSLDAIFVLSDSVHDYVEQTWQPRGEVVVIPHGDESVFLPGKHVVDAAEAPPHALFFGTWTAYKGVDALLDAFVEVRKRLPEARLTLAGAVGNVDPAEVRRRATEIGGITLRPGYVPLREVAPLMEAHRVVVLPYVRANQSGVAHLAHTFGRPVVATRVGDLPHVVIDGETGLLVEPGDRSALAEAMVACLSQPDLAARLGGAGRQKLGSTGSWDRIAETVATTLKGLP